MRTKELERGKSFLLAGKHNVNCPCYLRIQVARLLAAASCFNGSQVSVRCCRGDVFLGSRRASPTLGARYTNASLEWNHVVKLHH